MVLYRSTLSNHYHLLLVVGSLREGGQQFSEFNASFSPSPLAVFLASKKFAIFFLVPCTMECISSIFLKETTLEGIILSCSNRLEKKRSC